MDVKCGASIKVWILRHYILSFLKRVLKVRKSTSNYMVYFELGRFPLYINRYCRMLNYWFKILKIENCILKNCYEDMLESSAFKPNDKLNWGCKIRDILCKYGFIHVWLSQNVVNEDIFMLEFKQRVINTFLNEAISFLKNRQHIISISIYIMTITCNFI